MHGCSASAQVAASSSATRAELLTKGRLRPVSRRHWQGRRHMAPRSSWLCRRYRSPPPPCRSDWTARWWNPSFSLLRPGVDNPVPVQYTRVYL